MFPATKRSRFVLVDVKFGGGETVRVVDEGTAIVCYIAAPLLKLKDEGTAMLLKT